MDLISIIHFGLNAAPAPLSPQQAIALQQEADQAAGIVEWAILGVSSLFGVGIIGSLVYSAWHGVKAVRHLGQGIAASAALFTAGRAIGASRAIRAAGAAEAASGTLGSGQDPAKLGAGVSPADWKGMEGPLKRDGVVGQEIFAGGAANTVTFDNMMRKPNGSLTKGLDHVSVDTRFLRDPDNFEAAAQKVRWDGGSLHVIDKNGNEALYKRDDMGHFYHPGSAIPKGAAPGTTPNRTVSTNALRTVYYGK